MSVDDTFPVPTPTGGSLEVLTGGDPDGLPLLVHTGTPGAAVAHPALERAASSAGMRLVTYSRPGYGRSTPRPEPGMVADDVQDSAVVLHELGIEEFVTLGVSGGGPRAIGCAALLSAGCLAAATLAGVAPRDAEGLDWTAGMGPENVAELEAARQGAEPFEALLAETMPAMVEAEPEELRQALGELVTPVDAEYLTGELAETVARGFRHAYRQGVVGARDDGLALVNPWGFDVSAVHVPVAVWQGRQDAMVPYAHGVWLAAEMPGAHPHLFDDEGHLSLVHRLPEILADLRVLAGR